MRIDSKYIVKESCIAGLYCRAIYIAQYFDGSLRATSRLAVWADRKSISSNASLGMRILWCFANPSKSLILSGEKNILVNGKKFLLYMRYHGCFTDRCSQGRTASIRGGMGMIVLARKFPISYRKIDDYVWIWKKRGAHLEFLHVCEVVVPSSVSVRCSPTYASEGNYTRNV